MANDRPMPAVRCCAKAISLDQVTQQNAAMVEQTTAAAANLKTEAEHLAELVGRFRTGADTGPDRGVVRELKPRGGPPPALEAQRARLLAVANGPPTEEWAEF